ncbi:Transcription-repair-coupling factor (TRCF) (ATP-dependent helicase Mfd) [Candidatus Glomeribacter gigasporarum BEG34]|uniref:Transcription-repair-coupling factor n=1 Tax=Candidatus Glomeribacter gigasporarum BEG34 TaxID=1070319 RepID=G2J7R6_9BURK|nr:transcription-repair coupling factor [Candidatus Glomeribacter gigasporarum]CCD28811.1 Transcription-repair-coupling factor (TRCF) (ATP-dependent helicase Mfd) [Candidatus Glomeribacter gigasporarum BEG34]
MIPPIKPGARFVFDGARGAADALALARHFTAQLKTGACPLLAVICANAADVQRLRDEIAWFAPDARVRVLPDWETLPYDTFSPHQDLISERLATIHALGGGQCDLVLLSAATALVRMAPPSFMAAYTFAWTQGEALDAERLKTQLRLAAYEPVSQVARPGEYAIRGSLIDLFPMGAALPYRIDLFDERIDSIRVFDPDTQRSLQPVREVRLLPGREFPFDDKARAAFRSRWRETFEGDPSRSTIYKDVSAGILSAGIEYYLPLFFDETATLFDYLPAGAQLVLVGDLAASIQHFNAEARKRYAFLAYPPERPLLEPGRLFLSEEGFFTQAKAFARLVFPPSASAVRSESRNLFKNCNERASGGGGRSAGSRWTAPLPPLAINRHAADPVAALRAYLSESGHRTLVVCDSAGRRETMLQLFAAHGLKPAPLDSFAAFLQFLKSEQRFALTHAPLSAGFACPSEAFALITEHELYGAPLQRAHRRKAGAASDIDTMVRDLSELSIGAPVVHAQHGVGRYRGLATMNLGEDEAEFLHLDYAQGGTLYVPVAQLHWITRYSGQAPEHAPLHALGSGQWEKAKRRAAQQIRDTAAELLNLYARRAARQGHAFALTARDYAQFAAGFSFEETPDQSAAIEAVINDMKRGKPMDRLVCGDVGFGKTEVALRAAFIAAMDGRQVAVLVPTTLLAEQHFQTFSDRFADWPVRIAEFSRFKTAREIAAASRALAEGSIDIAIGTHQLLSKQLRFKRLGLVIIDEEHRFGVRQKEQLKALRAQVDVLTLTATPIPRTLGLALEGLRDFSVIATAPQKRLAIKTFVRREEDGVIREAALRELKRGGQVYFLHNEVETIDARSKALEALLPEARILVAHGQMHERALERVMRDFVAQRANMLLCTTIIETGIDVPSANTILIHRADKFGLAQLHQLRGRVGRSHHQAYAYLLVHDPQQLTKQATLRLDAIQKMEELGAGFYLAMHDLEIRGAGEVLGDKQSGEMHEIGFQLYSEMLKDAVEALKDGREPDLAMPLAASAEINLHAPALLPADYCGDVQQRLTLYKRLANCRRDAQIDTVQEALIDRFGPLPPPAQALIETHRLRWRAQSLGVGKMDASEERITLQFAPNPKVDAARIIDLVQRQPQFKLAGQDKLSMELQTADLPARIAALKTALRALGAPS